MLGTAPDCDLRVRGRYVSRRHCVVEWNGDELSVRDLDSRNGTEVDARRVSESLLPNGALLSLGDVTATHVAELRPGFCFEGLVGAAPGSLALFHRVNRVADSDTPTLLLGPSGVGKELLARPLHNRSPRATRPFVVVNCGALPATLAEAELFGTRRGAYTGAVQDREGAFARADGGTLFLDEVGELPPEVQPKLLRALEQGEVQALGNGRTRRVDVRVVAATNRPVDEAARCPQFRRELLYRLAGCRLRVAPLDERPEDIVPIATRVLQNAAGRARALTPEAQRWVAARSWPGNVRELRNLLLSSAALSRLDRLDCADLRAALGEPGETAQSRNEDGLGPLDRLIVQTLRRHDGDRGAALRSLGMPRSTFYARLRRMREDERLPLTVRERRRRGGSEPRPRDPRCG